MGDYTGEDRYVRDSRRDRRHELDDRRHSYPNNGLESSRHNDFGSWVRHVNRIMTRIEDRQLESRRFAWVATLGASLVIVVLFIVLIVAYWS